MNMNRIKKILSMVPQELKDLERWGTSLNRKDPKIPLNSKMDSEYFYEAKDLIELSEDKVFSCTVHHIGISITDNDPYVIINMDRVNLDSIENTIGPILYNLLVSHPTYVEVSFSGSGLTAIYKLPETQQKEHFPYVVNPSFGEREYLSTLKVRKTYQNITGNPASVSSNEIGIVSCSDLSTCFSTGAKS